MDRKEKEHLIKQLKQYIDYLSENDADIGFTYGADDALSFLKYLLGESDIENTAHGEDFLKKSDGN